MKKKLLMLIGGSVLSAFLLVGCANNVDEDNNPSIKGTNVDNRDNRILDRNGDNDDNGIIGDNNNDGIIDDNNDDVPDTKDRNTDKDLDPVKDDNEKGEDVIEDRNDMKDKNQKDQ
jgi:hypothetical protein